MRRIGTEVWAGIAMLVISIGVSIPSFVVGPEPTIGRLGAIGVLLLFLAALVTATASSRTAVQRVALAVAVVGAWTLVLTAQSTGLLLILLVVTAATSVHLVPWPVGAVLVALNTVVVAVAASAVARDVVEVILLTGFYLLIQVATMLSSATLIREQRMRRELAQANVELQAASVLLSESARTAERLRIARELHDLVGHQLTVLALELETLRHVGPDEAPAHVDRADRVARGLLRDVRAAVGELRTAPPDLERALRRMTASLPGLDVGIAVDPDLAIGEEAASALVRAAQEIVTNTLRHARAGALEIDVRREGDAIVLRARDDGRGDAAPVLGNGLLGLRERLEALGGEVDVDGRRGFAVTARVPAA